MMRGVMEDCGDEIGVDLRGASSEVLAAFLERMWGLADLRHLRPRHMPEQRYIEAMCEIAVQAAHELFGGAERAS